MDRFIVGTGRCGSTLLSRMLAEHRAVLSLFELFNGIDGGQRFAAGPLSGDAFARLFACEQPFINAVLRRGYPVEEVVYPFGDGARYRRGDACPTCWSPCCRASRASRTRSSTRPTPSPPRSRRARRRITSARSSNGSARASDATPGSSARARRSSTWRRSPPRFPTRASCTSIATDPRWRSRCASTTPTGCRSACSTTRRSRRDSACRSSVPIDLRAEPSADDPISQILTSRPPAALFGRYWCDQITRGVPAARALPPGRLLELRFETLVASPAESLARIERFFELPPDEGWIRRAAALVRGVPPLRAAGASRARARRAARRVRAGARAARARLASASRQPDRDELAGSEVRAHPALPRNQARPKSRS